MKNIFLKSLLFGFGVFMLFGVTRVEAAVMYMNVDKETAVVGDTLTVDVLIDSEGESINAAEASIEFPQNILEVTEISKEDSIFNFWLEDPVSSNEDGSIIFTGGSSSGFSGQSLQVLEISFEVIAGGSDDVVFSDGAVAAADGSGTNVLTEINGISFRIVPSSQIQPGVTPGEPTPPEQIERPAVPTGELPIKPEVSIPLYPDNTVWHNIISKFSAVWELPDDVTDVAAWLNNASGSEPTISEGLFVSKSFASLSDDIWYLHVRFKNDIGWGPTTHYRIAIDTAPPVPFNVSLNTESETDNPSPTLSYKSRDNLSGLSHYVIHVVGGEEVITNDEFHKLAPLAPGNRTVLVQAVDNAGNITEESVDIEILPIEAPVITSVSNRVFLDEDKITVAGTALPDSTVMLVLRSSIGDVVGERNVEVDSLGNWVGAFDEAVRRGEYTVLAKTIDSHGAQSLQIESPEISVVERPIFTIGGVGITQTWFFAFLIFILIGAFVLGFLYERLLSKKQNRNIFITKRDVVNAFNWIVKEVDKLLLSYTDIGPEDRKALETKRGFERIRDKAEKSAKYLNEQIEEIKKYN